MSFQHSDTFLSYDSGISSDLSHDDSKKTNVHSIISNENFGCFLKIVNASFHSSNPTLIMYDSTK